MPRIPSRQPVLFVVTLCLTLLMQQVAQAKSLNVLADIAPVNALLSAIVSPAKGSAPTTPLVPSNVSVHDFSLKPSDIGRIGQAEVIIWLGPDASPALAKLMQQPAIAAKALNLGALPQTLRLDARKAGLFDGQKANPVLDPHMWLSPENAILWSAAIADRLAQADPVNAARYKQNAAALIAEIRAAKSKATALLALSKVPPYAQFHDAYQYFEYDFDLHPIGAATTEDEEGTSLGVISDLRAKLAAEPASCVFVRDEVQAKRATPLLEGTKARIGWLDPLGRGLAVNNYSYPNLLLSVALGYANCFREVE